MTLAVVIASAALLALLTANAAAQAPAESVLTRTKSSVTFPTGNYLLTPYVSPGGETVLVHVQPSRSASEEWILDARTGSRWFGSPSEVMSRYRRLATESPADVQAGTAFDQQMMRQLGCSAPVSFCTSPADANVVLLMRWVRGGELGLELVDLRRLLAGMDALMTGETSAPDVTRDDQQWRLLELAARDPERRARWLEALRGIDSIERWQRLAAAAETGPRLMRWPTMRSERDGDRNIDLMAELELLALRLNVAMLAQAATKTLRGEQLRALADGLLLGNQLGFRGDVASHLVDVLIKRDATDRKALGDALGVEAHRRRAHGLWCYAEWMSMRPCAGTAPWEGLAVAGALPPELALTRPATSNRSAPSATPKPATATGQTAATPATPQATTATTSPASSRTAIPTTSAARPPTPAKPTANDLASLPREATSPQAGDAQQEWALVQGQANKQVLLAYNETSGHMAAEAGAVSGLSFVARSMGPVQDGRFELQIAPNRQSPLLLQYGAYRVKVRLVLDYSREDRCKAGLLCLFSSAERYARTERRDLVFILNPANLHSEKQRANFGNLVPAAAEDNQRYTSSLKEARLAIDAVRIDLK